MDLDLDLDLDLELDLDLDLDLHLDVQLSSQFMKLLVRQSKPRKRSSGQLSVAGHRVTSQTQATRVAPD